MSDNLEKTQSALLELIKAIDNSIDAIIDRRINKFIAKCGAEAIESVSEFSEQLKALPIDYEAINLDPNVSWQADSALLLRATTIMHIYEQLEAYGILGEKFNKMYQICGRNAEKLRRTLLFLNYGCISMSDFRNNLDSENPIPVLGAEPDGNVFDRYDSLTIFSSDYSKKEIYNSWVAYCIKNRDLFNKCYGNLNDSSISPDSTPTQHQH